MAVTYKPADLASDLHELAERELERWNVPGLELVVVKEGEVLFAGGFGRRHVARDLPVAEHTVFAHGSTGKAFTAFLAGLMVDDGLIDWDTPVRDYVPEFRLFDEFASARVSLRDLLSHRSGLPNHDFAWCTRPSLPREEIVARLRHLEPTRELRTTWQYCNIGYIVAGYILERVAGAGYEEELRKRVFEPLGMRDTYTDSRAVEALEDHAQPYRNENGTLKEIPIRPVDNGSPAGGIYSCAADTARWLMVQAGRGEIDGKRLISEATFGEMTRSQIPLNMVVPDPDWTVNGYGFGWAVGAYRGRPWHWHTGGIDGFTTEFMVLPREKIAVGVSNNAMSQLSIAVARLVTDHLLGAERDWGKEILDELEKMRAAAKEARESRDETNAVAAAHAIADYAGRYNHPGYGDLEVSEKGAGLVIRIGDLDCETSHRHYETWDTVVQLGGEAWTVPATFFTDASGEVSDLYVALEPTATDPIRFRRLAYARAVPGEPAH